MLQISDMHRDDYADIVDATNFSPAKLDADKPDQHFCVLNEEKRVQAHCSIWWRDAARVQGVRTGTIGHYAATDDESGSLLIETACRALRQRGCELAVGPMDGNTWRQYRFVTERGTERPFLFEPANPIEWPDQFKRQHFKPLANYVSDLNQNMAIRRPPLGDLRQKLANRSVVIGPLNVENSEDELDGVHLVASESFRDAFMYTRLDRESFREMYAPLLRQIDPRLILVAKQDDRVVGFIFAPPDEMQGRYQKTIDTIVIKTVAILPSREFAGLGRVLIVDLMERAVALGYTSAISALMHADNRSQKISSQCARPMRGYTLFGRALHS